MKSLGAWHQEIMNHIKDSGLINLSEYEVNGKSVFGTFSDVTRSKQKLKEFDYSDFKHGDDFNYISQDLIYSIAILELLYPYINNAVTEKVPITKDWKIICIYAMQVIVYKRFTVFGIALGIC